MLRYDDKTVRQLSDLYPLFRSTVTSIFERIVYILSSANGLIV